MGCHQAFSDGIFQPHLRSEPGQNGGGQSAGVGRANDVAATLLRARLCSAARFLRHPAVLAQAAKGKKAASVAQSQREREPYASGKRLHRARAVPQGVLVASTGAAKVRGEQRRRNGPIKRC